MQMAANEELEELDVVPIPSTMLTSSIDSGYLLNLNDYTTDVLSEAIEGLGDDAYAAYFPETDFLAGLPLHKERVNPVGLVVRSDIMEEIGVNAEDIVINPDDYDSFSQLDDLFAAVKEAYPEMTCVTGHLGTSYTADLGRRLKRFSGCMGKLWPDNPRSPTGTKASSLQTSVLSPSGGLKRDMNPQILQPQPIRALL